MIWFRLFLFFLFLAFQFPAIAQTESRSCLKFGIPEIESDTWKMGTTTITAFSVHGMDSVVFREDGLNSGNFLAKNGQIISPSIVVTDRQGHIKSIDSMQMGSLPSHPTYFGYEGLSAVKWEYGPTGIPSAMFRKNEKGTDSLVRKWYPNGVLESETLKGTFPQAFLYYPDGILKSVEKDTFINHWHVTRVRNYSEQGVIQTESWFRNGEPCANWFIYDHKGALSKTIKHASLDNRPFSETVEMEPELYYFVSEMAEFPGGQAQLYKYLSSKLEPVLCKHHFSGKSYVLRFEVQEDGGCIYRSVSGPEIYEAEPFFKAAIDNSPRWKPARREGKTSKQAFSLKVSVK